jgi:hypothetical protein
MPDKNKSTVCVVDGHSAIPVVVSNASDSASMRTTTKIVTAMVCTRCGTEVARIG